MIKSSIFSPSRINPRLPFLVFLSSLHTSKQQPKLHREHLFHAFENIQTIDEAKSLFHYMLLLKPTPYIQHYHKLLTTILKMHHYPLVVVLFKKLMFLGFPVDDYFMNIVVNCYSLMKEVDLSYVIIGSFIKRGFSPDILTFNWVIKGMFIRQNVEKAMALFRVLVKRKVEINEFTIAIVLDGLCKAGEVGRARRLFEIAERNGEWKLDVVAYSSMIDGFCKAGMLRDAMEVLCRMIDKNVIPDIYTYNTFLHGLCIHKELQLACSIFSDLPSKGVTADLITYNVMIMGLCRGGQFEIAKDVLENMEKCGFIADSITCNIILKECLCQSSNIHSVNLLKQIVGREFQLDASSFFVLLRKLPKIQKNRGVFDDDVINHLIRLLISGDGMHEIDDNNVLVNRFFQKLY